MNARQPAVSGSLAAPLGEAPLDPLPLRETTVRLAPPAPPSEGIKGGRRTLFGFVAMVFGMFMAILDIQIVSASLSEIQAGLAASADEISWVQTSYLIAEVVMIPLSGYLSRVLSTRVLFTLSAVAFTAMSAVCASMTSIEGMIVARALQGFLGGAMIPTVFATSFLIFPGSRRGAASAVIGLVATLAPTIGPTLGGYLTDLFSWHWLFLINVVPGVIVAIAVFMLVDIDKPNTMMLRGFDAVGLLSMAAFLGCLEYVLEEGNRNDWFDDASIRNAGAVAAVAGVLFFWRVLSYRNPIVDLRAFKDRNFAVGSFYSFMVGIGLYGLVYILPLYLARVRGLSALQIGEIMFVTGLTQFFTAPVAANLLRKLDPRLMIAMGFTLLGLSTWQLDKITADWGFNEMLWPQIFRGAALMLCMIPVNVLALGTLPPDKLKNASGLFNLTRNLGGAFGLAGINTLLSDRTNFYWNRLGADINLARPEVQGWLDQMAQRLGDRLPGDPDLAAAKMLGNMVLRQATVLSFADCFMVLCLLFVGTMVTLPMVRKPRTQPGAGGGGH